MTNLAELRELGVMYASHEPLLRVPRLSLLDRCDFLLRMMNLE